MTPSAEPEKVGLQAGGEAGAILRAEHAADQQQRGEHDVDRPGGQGVDHGGRGADREDHDEAGADHHARRHAEDVDHRRDQDEAAADAEQHGQDAGDEAQPERCQRRKVQAARIEAPAEGQGGDQPMVALARLRLRFGGLPPAERFDRVAQHEEADRQ